MDQVEYHKVGKALARIFINICLGTFVFFYTSRVAVKHKARLVVRGYRAHIHRLSIGKARIGARDTPGADGSGGGGGCRPCKNLFTPSS